MLKFSAFVSANKVIRFFSRQHHYHWRGINSRGTIERGSIVAKSKKIALLKLKSKISVVTRCQRKTLPKHLKNTEIIVFFAKLSKHLQRGLTLAQSLQTFNHSPLQYIATNILNQLKKGLSFSEALRHHPKNFDVETCALVKAGEKTQQLATVLNQIAQTCHERNQFYRLTLRRIAYPVTLLILTILISITLLFVITPQIESMLSQAQGQQAWLTHLLIDLYHLLKDHGLIILLVTLFISGSPTLRKYIRYLAQGAPFIRSLTHYHALHRFCHCMALFTAADTPLPEALTLAFAASSLKHADRSIQAIKAGSNLSEALNTHSLITEHMLLEIKHAEVANQLEDAWHSLANHYQQLLKTKLENLSKWAEPVIMIWLSLFIGSIVIGLYLPIMQISSTF